MLGRETALQRCHWTEDGWIRMVNGGNRAQLTVEAPNLEAHPFAEEADREDFDTGKWNLHLNSLRVPLEKSWASLEARPGYLRLRGRESLFSLHEQSLVARRLQHFRATVETCLEFQPKNFHEMAGLTLFYDQNMFYYLRVYYSETFGCKCIGILSADNGKRSEWLESRIPIPEWDRIYLRAVIHDGTLNFYCSSDGELWWQVGTELDASKCSDEYSASGHFTGAFVGICCQDSYRKTKHADFDYFEYKETK